jgi:membrane protease YdiL (CAAX protease family)
MTNPISRAAPPSSLQPRSHSRTLPDTYGSSAFASVAHRSAPSILITLLLAKGASLQYFWQELTSFSLGQRLQFLLIGVQVVILEETLLRGYLQSGLEARTSRRRAVVITALAFAAYHLRFDDPMLFAAQFCYGLVGHTREHDALAVREQHRTFPQLGQHRPNAQFKLRRDR